MPTFVFPVKRRGFEEAFVQSFLMLERLSIPDQETIVGLFRVNLTKMQGKYQVPFIISLSNDVWPAPGLYVMQYSIVWVAVCVGREAS